MSLGMFDDGPIGFPEFVIIMLAFDERAIIVNNPLNDTTKRLRKRLNILIK